MTDEPHFPGPDGRMYRFKRVGGKLVRAVPNGEPWADFTLEPPVVYDDGDGKGIVRYIMEPVPEPLPPSPFPKVYNRTDSSMRLSVTEKIAAVCIRDEGNDAVYVGDEHLVEFANDLLAHARSKGLPGADE